MDSFDINRRRLGAGMVVFGLIGVGLAALITLALLGGAVAARNLDEQLAAEQARVAASLNQLTATLDSLAVTVDNAKGTLTASGETLVHAGQVLGDVADTSEALASTLNVNILGSQPLAGASSRLQDLAGRIRLFQGDATAMAAKVDVNAADVASMADRVRSTNSQLTKLADRIASFDGTSRIVNLVLGGIVLGGLLTAWVGIAAAGLAWLGWRLRRAAADPPAAARA